MWRFEILFDLISYKTKNKRKKRAVQTLRTGNIYTYNNLRGDRCRIDDFRGACAVKGNVQVAALTSSVSTTEMLSTHDVTLRSVDGSLFHVQI